MMLHARQLCYLFCLSIGFQSIIFCSESSSEAVSNFFPLDFFVKDVSPDKFYLGCAVAPSHNYQSKHTLNMLLTTSEDNWAFLDQQALGRIRQKINPEGGLQCLLGTPFHDTKIRFQKNDSRMAMQTKNLFQKNLLIWLRMIGQVKLMFHGKIEQFLHYFSTVIN